MTPAEATLWELLRNQQIGIKFRRIHVLHGFTVDFYAPSVGLAVEIDGGIHCLQQEQDAARTACFSAHGITVLRFTNIEVQENAALVAAKIFIAAMRPHA